jgi:hypothetical protein
MINRNYTWRESYVHAVLETNPELKFVQICEAMGAIEQRRLSPVETNEERYELENAEEGIRALISECGMKSFDMRMLREEKVQAPRTVWVAKCPGCGDTVEHSERRAKIRLCLSCQKWIPYVEVSPPGPTLVQRTKVSPPPDPINP